MAGPLTTDRALTPAFVRGSTYASIGVQVVAGLVGLLGLLVPLSPEHLVLRDLLGLETAVQLVQLIAYVLLAARFHLGSMAATRYFDWMITTPVMLFTFAAYLRYSELQEKDDVRASEALRSPSFLRGRTCVLASLVVSNLGMLLLGYLGEVGALARPLAWVASSFFFLVTFGILYLEFARKSEDGRRVFLVLFLVWSLYAATYFLSAAAKNIAINGLDIVSKNFFGVFLAYVIFQRRADVARREKE